MLKNYIIFFSFLFLSCINSTNAWYDQTFTYMWNNYSYHWIDSNLSNYSNNCANARINQVRYIINVSSSAWWWTNQNQLVLLDCISDFEILYSSLPTQNSWSYSTLFQQIVSTVYSENYELIFTAVNAWQRKYNIPYNIMYLAANSALPPLYPTNQPKPQEYFKNVDSEYNENIWKWNCLYTNPNTTVYEKPLQYCKASDFWELWYSFTNRYCEDWYSAYINARIGWIDNFFIRSLVCANCNNESCIWNVKTNDSSYLNLQPFLTFWSILNFYYTWWVNTYWLQTGALSVEWIMQTYPDWFMNYANDSLIYWYIIPTDIVRQTYPTVWENSSPINYDISQTSTNSNWIEYKYYLDLNFEVCRTWHYLTCPLNQWLFSELKDYPAAKSDLFTTYKQYAYKLYETWITLPEIYETDPPEIIKPSPSLSPNPDNNIYKCELSGLEWYQYLWWVVWCLSNTAVWTYNKWVNFIQNVWWYFKKFLDIWSDRTQTKTFWFFIDTANAQTWDFTDIMWWVTKGITRKWWNNYNFFSNFMWFAEKAVYTFVFVLIVSTFLYLYFKK